MRAAENASRSRSVAVRQSGFVAGGHDLPTSQPIDHDTLRLEVRAAEVRAAERLKLPSPRSRRALSPRSKEEQGDLSHIDLVVLHATESLTAMDRFVTLANGGQSAHFLIDWDGTVYQTLDLTMLAAHTGDDALDKRSVAIELVTPLSQDMPPLPSHAQGVERPMSQRLRIQGQLVRAWGYTAPQMASLSSLLVDLVRTLPHLKGTLTGGASVPTSALSVKEREDVRGVIGALHIDPTTIAPGPGFEWPLIRRALERLR